MASQIPSNNDDPQPDPDGQLGSLANTDKNRRDNEKLALVDSEQAESLMIANDKAQRVGEAFNSAKDIVASTVAQEAQLMKMYDFLPSDSAISKMDNPGVKQDAKDKIVQFVVDTQKGFSQYRQRILECFTKLYLMKTELGVLYSSLEQNNYSDQVIQGIVQTTGENLRLKLGEISALRLIFVETVKDNPDVISKAFKDLGISGQDSLKGLIDTKESAEAGHLAKAIEYAGLQKVQGKMLQSQNTNVNSKKAIKEFFEARYKSAVAALEHIKAQSSPLIANLEKLETETSDRKKAFEEQMNEEKDELVENAHAEFDAIKAEGVGALDKFIKQWETRIHQIDGEIVEYEERIKELQAHEKTLKNECETKKTIEHQANQQIYSQHQNAASRLLILAEELKNKPTPHKKCSSTSGWGLWKSTRTWFVLDTDQKEKWTNEGEEKYSDAQRAQAKYQKLKMDTETGVQNQYEQLITKNNTEIQAQRNIIHDMENEKEGKALKMKEAGESRAEFAKAYDQFNPEKASENQDKYDKIRLEQFDNREQARLDYDKKTVYSKLLRLVIEGSEFISFMQLKKDAQDLKASEYQTTAAQKDLFDSFMGRCEAALKASKDRGNPVDEKIRDLQQELETLETNNGIDNVEHKKIMEKCEEELKAAQQLVDEARKAIQDIEQDIPLKIKDLLFCSQIVSDTRANQAMASVLNEVMPSTCDLVLQFFTLALNMVAPLEGEKKDMPALKSAEEVKEYSGKALNEIDEKYQEVDEEDNDEGYTRLQVLFRDNILKALLKNKNQAPLARSFIEEKLIYASLSALNEDCTAKKEFFVNEGEFDYSKLAIPSKAKLKKIAEFEVKEQQVTFSSSDRKKQVTTVLTPAVFTIRNLPSPDDIYKVLLLQADSELKAIQATAQKNIEEKDKFAIEEEKE